MARHSRPEIVEAVRRMKAERKRNPEIAMAVGMSVRQVRRLCDVNKITRPPPGQLLVVVGAQLYNAYRGEAERRGMRLPSFVRRILTTVSHDDLFNAILDDK